MGNNLSTWGGTLGKQPKKKIRLNHNYDTNKNVLNDLLKTYDNLKIINTF